MFNPKDMILSTWEFMKLNVTRQTQKDVISDYLSFLYESILYKNGLFS